MVKIIEGDLLAQNATFAIVVSRFNELVTKPLLAGCVDTFKRHGVQETGITVVRVPGAFELPLIADKLAKSEKYSAVCCLGAVIQGETTHHEYINHAVADGIMQVGRESGIPVSFGVLTCQTMEQALDRSGGKAGNKGAEAALAAIEMVNVLRAVEESS